MVAGGTIIIPNAINTLAITVSIIKKRDENREAYLKCGFQLAGHVGREQNAHRHSFRSLQRAGIRQSGKQP